MPFKRGELVELKNKRNPLAGYIGHIIRYQADIQKYLVQFSPDQKGFFAESELESRVKENLKKDR